MTRAMDAADRPDRPVFLFFDYYVFESQNERATEEEGAEGVFLVGNAEAQHLRQFFDPLYEKVGVGISTSDDEIISGTARLSALRKALDAAIRDAEHRPPEWPVELGFSKASPSGVLYDPVVENASRSRLLEFLRGALRRVDHALVIDGYIHFDGGT